MVDEVGGEGFALPVEEQFDGLVGHEAGSRCGRPREVVVGFVVEVECLAAVHSLQEPLRHVEVGTTVAGAEFGERASCGVQAAVMVDVLIDDVPADVYAALEQRAAAAGQPIEAFVRAALIELAAQSIGRVGFAQAVLDLEVEREGRFR